MLRSMKEIRGYKLIATDGEIGDIDGFILDEDTWRILYFLVGIGGLLKGRKAFIAPVAVLGAGFKEKNLLTDLNVGQVNSSPIYDLEKPLTRKQMNDLNRYYVWKQYWSEKGTPEYGVAGGEAETSKGEPNVIRVSELAGYKINAAEGEVGGIDDLLVDDVDWVVRYIVADTRKWLPGKKALLSLDWVEIIDEKNKNLRFDIPREVILRSPEYSFGFLDRDYELRLFGYYRREGYWAREKRAA